MSSSRKKYIFHVLLLVLAFSLLDPIQPLPPVPRPSAPLPRCATSRQSLDLWSAAQEVPLHAQARRRPLAFTVPVHPPTFPFTLDLLYARHLHPEQFDLFLIFTTAEDAALYRRFLAQAPRVAPNSTLEFLSSPLPPAAARAPHWEALYAPLVLQWPCHSSIDLADRKVIITAKKLYALALLHACYALLVTCDAETSVLRPGAVQAAAAAAAASMQSIVAAWVPGYADMLEASVAMFPARDLAAIRAATHDFALWSWWNQIPVWRAEEVPAFLLYLDFPARIPQAFNEFEHLSYTNWRVLHRNASYALLAAPGLDGPFGNTADAAHWLAAAALSPPGPAWMTLHFCRRNAAFCAAQPTIALLHHLDRGETPWWRSSWDAGHMPALVEAAPDVDTPRCGMAGQTQLLTPIA